MTNHKHEASVPEMAGLVHEALEQLGWQGDTQALVERVQRLDIGLPAEDEFSALLSWLGRCKLVHKLDELQNPPGSRNVYCIPDLLAVLNYEGQDITVLIEVKVKKSKSLSWRPDYFEGLKRYAQQLGLPLLIAWKWNGIWTLFEAKHFQRPNQNYKIDLITAMKENLLGLLAGDFLFVLQPGAGFHFHFRKITKLGEVEADGTHQEDWAVIIEDVYFTNGLGQRVTELSSGLSQFLLSTLQEAELQNSEEFLIQSFEAGEENSFTLAQQMLANFLHSSDEATQIRWRLALQKQKVSMQASTLREAAKEGITEKFVRYVADWFPHTKPDFLEQSPAHD